MDRSVGSGLPSVSQIFILVIPFREFLAVDTDPAAVFAVGRVSYFA
jgi:hypothetical protein